MGQVCHIQSQTATSKVQRSREQIAAKIISFEDVQQRLGLRACSEISRPISWFRRPCSSSLVGHMTPPCSAPRSSIRNAGSAELGPLISGQTLSQRRAADVVEVPRSTMQGWLERKALIDAPEPLVEFFESPEGVRFLHRLVLAAQVVITLMAPGSIRLVCTFLVLCGLHRFVASSYGSQQKAIAELERELCAFGASELRRLAQQMHRMNRLLKKEASGASTRSDGRRRDQGRRRHGFPPSFDPPRGPRPGEDEL